MSTIVSALGPNFVAYTPAPDRSSALTILSHDTSALNPLGGWFRDANLIVGKRVRTAQKSETDVKNDWAKEWEQLLTDLCTWKWIRGIIFQGRSQRGGSGGSAEPPSKLMIFLTIVMTYGKTDGRNSYLYFYAH